MFQVAETSPDACEAAAFFHATCGKGSEKSKQSIRKMIISHQHRFIILCPWKTASSTIHLRFRSYNESSYSRFFYFNRVLNRVVHQHLTLADVLSLPESRLGYFMASFVRNPYDRAYSGFIQLQRDIAEQPKAMFPSAWIRELVLTQLAENERRLIAAGYDFNAWISMFSEAELHEAGRNTNLPLHPAGYWTHVDGRQKVDFVGKVETFESDLTRLCATIGIPVPARQSANVTEVPQTNIQPAYRYVSRMSRAAIDRINRLFAQDFSMFHYEQV